MTRQGLRAHALCMALGAALSLMVALALTANGAAAARTQPADALQARPIPIRARPLPRMAHAATSTDLPMPQTPPGNFPFQQVTSADGMIVVHYYGQPASFAQILISFAQADLAHPVHDTLGYSLKHPIHIYVYGSRGDFLAGAPVTNPAETGALTVAETNSIYIQTADPQDEGATDNLPHELTHIVFHQNEDVDSFEQNFFGVFPNWLDEGLATYDEPADSRNVADYTRDVTDAVQGKQVLDLLRQFNLEYPSDPDTDFLAYAESRSFITYLVATYGLDGLHHFLADARDGDLQLAAEDAFGADLATLQNQWQASVGVQLAPGTRLGYAPILPPAAAFHPGALPAIAGATHPFPLDPRAAVPAPALIVLTLLLALALSQMAEEWLATRRTGVNNVPVEQDVPAWAAIYRQPALAPPAPAVPDPPDPPHPPVTDLPSAPPADAPSVQTAPQPASVMSPPAPVTQQASPARVRRVDLPLLLLPLPLALLAGALAIRLDPAHEWRVGYIVAGFTAAPVALAQLGNVARGVRSCPRFRMIGLVLALLVVAMPLLQAEGVGRTQAQAYEGRGAYALALRFFAASGEPADQLASDSFRVHVEWAQAALGVHDYATATTQLRAAILLDPGSDVATQQVRVLSKVTLDWGEALVGSGQYQQAVQVYTDAATSATCDSACRSHLHATLAAAYVTWANALLLSGNTAGAVAKLQVVRRDYADTPSAQTAEFGLREIPAEQALRGALSAGTHNGAGAMEAQLRGLIAKYPASAAAVAASETPQPVTGVIADQSGASVAGDHVFFLPFATQAQAARFNFDFRKDSAPFKVVATLGANGSFTTRLPPGYWYVVCWHDPSQAAFDDFNEPAFVGNEAFMVTPLQPANVGVIFGF